MKRKVVQHLKTISFLSLWFAIPVVILAVFLSPKGPTPTIYQAQNLPVPTTAAGGIDIFFKVIFKSVVSKNANQLPIFIKAINEKGETTVFNNAYVWQDENNPALWRGTLNFPEQFLGITQEATQEAQPKSFTFYIKGPMHLQRRFDKIMVAKGQELDFTDKIMLPGDVALPDTGQDDKVDNLDRDYLWSLIAKDTEKPTKEELAAADLDLNGQITSRDYSLLIDTGIGSVGEK